MTSEIARRRGRPRQVELDQAIIGAARQQLLERGYPGLTVDGVASAAEVSRSTVYRRYGNKEELAAAVILASTEVREPDTGDAVQDLLTALEEGGRAISAQEALSMWGALLGDAEAGLMAIFRERVVGPRFGLVRRLVAHAAGRGRSAAVDHTVVAMALAGTLFAQQITGIRLSREQVLHLIGRLTAPPRAPRGRRTQGQAGTPSG